MNRTEVDITDCSPYSSGALSIQTESNIFIFIGIKDRKEPSLLVFRFYCL